METHERLYITEGEKLRRVANAENFILNDFLIVRPMTSASLFNKFINKQVILIDKTDYTLKGIAKVKKKNTYLDIDDLRAYILMVYGTDTLKKFKNYILKRVEFIDFKQDFMNGLYQNEEELYSIF